MEMIKLSQPRLTEPVLNAYRSFVDAIDQKQEMDSAISSLALVDRFYVSERIQVEVSPKLIAHRTEGMIAGRLGDYFDRFFRTDPVIRALEGATETGKTMVLRVLPEDIPEADYREHFFIKSNIIERVSFVERMQGRWLIMNVARRAPQPRFSDKEVDSLAAFSQLLLPLVARSSSSGQENTRTQGPTREDLEIRFAQQFPALSPRERQVCARTVIGMTSEATALDLGIGIGSVQTYRKRAFNRLEICSAFQLAHLIMQ